MSYDSLHDTTENSSDSFIAATVICKFCDMGFVTSKKYTSVFITILDGVFRLYASKEACTANSQDTLMRIPLTRHHEASAPKRKNYAPDRSKVLELFEIYIQINNGIFMPTRLIKIASPVPQLMEKIIRCIELHTR
jgi:hypothetical protein